VIPVLRFQAPPPLSLYVHFPWCVRKCPYCDFNSHALRDVLPEHAYIDALLEDLEQELPALWGRTIHTVFLGGGTPSLFSAPAIERLLSRIRARLQLHPDAEITLEANPGTAGQERFAGYRDAGVNRLSLGIQSLSDSHLNALGRIHDAEQSFLAVRAARAAGFDNINLDLMFGLPDQDAAATRADLESALALQPEHLSWYQLTVEPNTRFHADPPVLPDDDEKWAMQTFGQTVLASHGYNQYEVSAFARAGQRCRHNLNYWRFGDYIGIGAGAHGKITDVATGCMRRRWKIRHPRGYLEAAGARAYLDGERALSEPEIVFEYALNRLRLKEPFSLTEFESCCGLKRDWIMPLIQQAHADGLMICDGDLVQHTASGWLFLNDLLERFLPEEVQNAGYRSN
jgi:putative oxygen-independent coproporphyrinogen III oxidase